MLQLQNESDLDPLFVCLRMLIRRCVYDNIGRDEIQKLFPKFHREWRQDVLKDQGALPRLKTMTWDMANPDAEFADRVAVINLKLLNDSQSRSKESEVKFELGNDTLETMLNSMYSIRDQLSNVKVNISIKPSNLSPLELEDDGFRLFSHDAWSLGPSFFFPSLALVPCETGTMTAPAPVKPHL
ncbi:hypothetical protein Prudu_729S000400 [Prunus dulcis]|uniref:Uncharacterized protein n=1 Tax=Prunus dulcis TaxID=3755 RepID=A0A5H2XQM9_PRUDU|nr:hypothetical protein Prudu_729S000400 [Prunus dulcis]